MMRAASAVRRGTISPAELFFLLWFARLASVICFHPEQKLAPEAPFWAPTLLPAAAALVLIPLYGALARRFPRLHLFASAEGALGRWPGKLVALAFVVFFLDVARLDTRIFSEMIKINFLLRTPLWVIIPSMLAVVAWAVWNGPEGFGRAVLVLGLITAATLLVVLGMAAKDLDLRDVAVLPPDLPTVGRAAITPAALFGELVVVLALHPLLASPGALRRPVGAAIGAYAAVAALVLVWSVGLYGTATATATLYPAMQMARDIRMAEFLERIEGLMMVAWVATWFAKTGLFLYAGTLGLAQVLGLRGYRPLVWPLAVVVGLAAWFVGLSTTDILRQFDPQRTVPLGVAFGYALPLVLLAVAALRGVGAAGPSRPPRHPPARTGGAPGPPRPAPD